jgi:hypothetical protein
MCRIISHTHTYVRKINDTSKVGSTTSVGGIREHDASAFFICKVTLLPETRLRKKEKSTKNALQAVSHTLQGASHTLPANFCQVCAVLELGSEL